MITFSFGKSKVRIHVEGCITCGTLWSSGWQLVREVPVTVGSRKATIGLHRCADCIRKHPEPVEGGEHLS